MAERRDTSNDVAMTREQFKAWIKEHDMTLTDVAELLGLTRQAVVYWYEGKRAIPEPIGRILVFLGQRPEMMREF